jgi:hypothetical protein
MKKIIVLTLVVALFIPLFGCGEKSDKKISNYDISISLNADMTLDGKMTYSFTPNSDISSVYFSLYPNAFSSTAEISPVYKMDELLAYPNGKSYGDIQITTVKSRGKVLDFEVTGTNKGTLKVGLNETVKSGKETDIYIEFKVKLANVKHRTGYGDDTVNLTNFYPVACVLENGKYYESVYYPAGDPFYLECSNYKVSLTVPPTYVVASSLAPISTVWSADNTEYNYERENVRDIAFILSKNFNVLEKTCNGVSVKYYYYGDKNPEKTLETACSSLRYFSDKYYRYPYAEYVVAEGDFIYGGMEYPCLSLISSSVSNDYRDYVVAHETAHQWFYGILGVNQNEIGFFDEGLTELSTALFLSEYTDTSLDNYVNQAINSYLSIREALVYAGNTRPPVMDRNLKDFSSEAEYVMIAYNRSEIAFNDVRKTLGDAKFFKFIKGFINQNAYKNVTLKDFEKALNKTSKTAGKVFNLYVNGEKVVQKAE